MPTLTPGSGWSGATAQPPNVGSPAVDGYNATAIARWNVVPHQEFDGTINVGVVAGHFNGIDRVELAVDGGSWAPVLNPSTNPSTGVDEYWATIDASDFTSDGVIEVRARVFPIAGRPRVLGGTIDNASADTGNHSLFLHRGIFTPVIKYVSPTGNDSNDGTSAGSPKKTIVDAIKAIKSQVNNGNSVDGGVVKLMAGDHIWHDPSGGTRTFADMTSWLLIEAADGENAETVRIYKRGNNFAPASGNNVRFRLRNITITNDYTVSERDALLGNGNESALWWDQGTVITAFQTDGVTLSTISATRGNWGISYATSSRGVGGKDVFRSFTLVRDCVTEEIGEDQYTDTRMIVRCQTRPNNPGGGGLHGDVLLYNPGKQNCVCVDFYCDEAANSQGLFFDTTTDVLIRNAFFNNNDGVNVGKVFQVFPRNGLLSHLVIEDSTFIGGADFRPDDPSYDGVDLVRLNNTMFSGADDGTPDAPPTDTGVVVSDPPSSSPYDDLWRTSESPNNLIASATIEPGPFSITATATQNHAASATVEPGDYQITVDATQEHAASATVEPGDFTITASGGVPPVLANKPSNVTVDPGDFRNVFPGMTVSGTFPITLSLTKSGTDAADLAVIQGAFSQDKDWTGDSNIGTATVVANSAEEFELIVGFISAQADPGLTGGVDRTAIVTLEVTNGFGSDDSAARTFTIDVPAGSTPSDDFPGQALVNPTIVDVPVAFAEIATGSIQDLSSADIDAFAMRPLGENAGIIARVTGSNGLAPSAKIAWRAQPTAQVVVSGSASANGSFLLKSSSRVPGVNDGGALAAFIESNVVDGLGDWSFEAGLSRNSVWFARGFITAIELHFRRPMEIGAGTPTFTLVGTGAPSITLETGSSTPRRFVFRCDAPLPINHSFTLSVSNDADGLHEVVEGYHQTDVSGIAVELGVGQANQTRRRIRRI